MCGGERERGPEGKSCEVLKGKIVLKEKILSKMCMCMCMLVKIFRGKEMSDPARLSNWRAGVLEKQKKAPKGSRAEEDSLSLEVTGPWENVNSNSHRKKELSSEVWFSCWGEVDNVVWRQGEWFTAGFCLLWVKQWPYLKEIKRRGFMGWFWEREKEREVLEYSKEGRQ